MSNKERIFTRIDALKDLALEALKNGDIEEYHYCLGEIHGLRFAVKMLGVTIED